MIIRIKDGEAFILDDEEVEKAKKERKTQYWLKVKGTEDFIIDDDKNKVRPIVRDLINRMPKSLEIFYLQIITWLLAIVFVWVAIGFMVSGDGKKIDAQTAILNENTKKIESVMKIIGMRGTQDLGSSSDIKNTAVSASNSSGSVFGLPK